MKRVSYFSSIFLATMLFSSQAFGAYLETLSVTGPKANMNVSVSGMQRPSVGILMAANTDDAAEAEDLDALGADKAPEATKPAADSKAPAAETKAPAPAKAVKSDKPAAKEKASDKQQMSPATAATVNKGDMCKMNKECDRGDVCLDGHCIDRDDVDDETLMKGTKYNLEGKQWAFWGGLAGHLLWGTGLIASFAIADPSLASAAGVWGIYTASTIVPTIAANSAIDNVGVYGAPGQKFGSWFLFSTGLITFGLLELFIVLDDTVDNGAVGGATGNDEGIINVNGAWTAILLTPSMLSGILMSSVAMRSHREVRRVKRRAAPDELKKSTEADGEKTSMRFDIVPYVSGADRDMSGAVGQWTLRF